MHAGLAREVIRARSVIVIGAETTPPKQNPPKRGVSKLGWKGIAEAERTTLLFPRRIAFELPESFTIDLRQFAVRKEKQRYYLLPGMGGRALRRKRKRILQWSIVAGLFVAAAVAGVLYLLYEKSLH